MRTPTTGPDRTLVDILRERATRTPDREALVFLDGAPAPVTDAELDREARSMASALLEHAVPGDRALILLPPGRSYVTAFLGCLYAGLVAVPQYPPTARRGGGTVLATAVDAGVAVAVSDADGVRSLAADHPELAAVPATWVVVEDVPEAPVADPSWRGPRKDSLALLQYTSGSTGVPKGVMVRHDNLVHGSAVIANALGTHPGSRSVSWLPPYHDMGLIGGILQPLYSGFTGMLMAPMAFLRSPFRWLEAISRYRATLTAAPDFGYLECARRISREEAATLDLTSWEHAMVGAEPVRASTLDAFVSAFGPHGFRRSAFHPCYGLAEATLFVTGGRPGGGRPRVVTLDRAALRSGVARESPADAGPGAAVVEVTACGGVVSEDRVLVVDPASLRPRGEGEVGEILVGGPTVAAGYWRRTDEAAAAFAATVPGTPGAFLRTGDLGFQLDGDLFVTGRAKDLIIVGGRNHYPHDLEATGEAAHHLIAPARSAAFSSEVDGTERVVLVHEVVRGFAADDAAEVAEAVTSAVTTEHGVAPYDVVLVRPGKVPTTTSGKVRRGRCRELWLDGALPGLPHTRRAEADPSAAPSPAVSPAVADILCQALKVDRDAVRPDVPLVALGLDSLRASGVAEALRAVCGAAPPLAELLGDLTPRGLSAWAAGTVPGPPPPAAAAEAADRSGRGTAVTQPADGTREWLWLLDRTGAGPAYTIVGGVRLRGTLDVERLRRSVSAVLGRHPSLRTTFAPDGDGRLLSTVRPAQPVPLPVVDVTDGPDGGAVAALEELASRGFDLATGPLLRAVLVRSGEHDWTLGLVVHHIAVDGWSLALLLRELGTAYTAGRLPAEPAPVTPPARGAGPAPGDAEFWRAALEGACAVALPLDRPVAGRRDWQGSSHGLDLPTRLVDGVRACAATHRATPFMVLLAALTGVLARWTGQSDLVVGTPAARREAGTSGDVGLFVNTLPIRVDASGDPDFAQLLGRVRRACLSAYAHQHVPFERILDGSDTLDPPGPRAPLVRVCLAVQSLPLEPWQADGLTAEPFELPSPGAQFEFAVHLTERPDGSMAGHTLHATGLLDDATVASLRDDLVAVLEAVTGGGEGWPLSRLPAGAGRDAGPAEESDDVLDVGGFRVSPARIAELLRAHPAVAGAVVRAEPAACPAAGGHSGLVAELTRAESAGRVPDSELRSFLSAELPGVAIPRAYRWEEPPAAFELVSLTGPDADAFVPPRDEVEQELAAIWCEVLGLPEVSVEAGFFELGGHSLQAARIVARIEAAFGTRLSAAEMLSAEVTVGKLAAVLRGATAPTPGDPDVDSAVDALDQLSDEEIAELLGRGEA